MDHFTELLQGLAELDDDGYVHQVYSVVLQTVNSEKMVRLLAESLHQRWLSDNGFAPVAARLASTLSDLHAHDGDFQFGSMVYAMLMNDYRDRTKLREANPVILCNAAQFGFEFYNHFRHKGAFYESLIDPLLDILDLLLSDDCTEHEIDCASHLLQVYGAHLQAHRYKRMQDLCIKVRSILINSDKLTAKIRYRLLEIIELSQSRWDIDTLTPDVTKLYDRMRDRFGDHCLNLASPPTTMASSRRPGSGRDGVYPSGSFNSWTSAASNNSRTSSMR